MILFTLVLSGVTLVLVNGSKVSWPALEIKSNDFFEPLMTSFSKFPFHDIYETPPSPDMLIPHNRSPVPKTFREWSKQLSLDKIEDTAEGRARLCEFLSLFPIGRDEKFVGRRRFLPLKLRRLLKYCRNI
ncbi:uncharacterized protein LOC131681403 [Topomyia yanbarensis]|uniref:uncharacterized protein LOC131681403 n=1 Tax=Topomyia yanbarensis TaxID=2498891 RepID=UPI00273BB3B3|nr:uncharacterized protein LOC131681403 [Topomyia yanbarensis]